MTVDCYSEFTLQSTCACDLHIPNIFHPNQITPTQLWRHIDFFKMALQTLFQLRV